MIKRLVLLLSLSIATHAGTQEWLLALIDADTNSSNETEVDRCDDEFTDMKVCISSIVEKYDFDGLTSNIMKKELILSILDEIQNASCFETTNCTIVKVGNYVFDSFAFIGEAVFREGFECLVKELETVSAKASQCVNLLVTSGEIKDMKDESFYFAAKLLSECTISKFSCSEDEQYALIAGAHRIIELIENSSHPEKILKEIGVPEDSISKEEMSAVLSYFVSIFK
ncbi:unnamed protein product [Caenorhabditis brenneri]